MVPHRKLMILLTAALLLGTDFTICVEAQEKSKTEQKKSSAPKKISEKQLEAWMNQLSEGTFRERRTASNNLSKAGKQALPALVNGTQRKDAELATRCVEIIIKMYRGKNKTLISAAEKALEELESSSNKSIAQRAKNVTDPIYQIEKLGGSVAFDRSGKVHSVVLSKTNVTDVDLVHLKKMSELRDLFLDHTKITDTGLEHLKGMKTLERLFLDSTKVTDTGLAHLKGLTKLRTLVLDNTPITDDGLVHLKRMSKMGILWLNNTKITDAGLVHTKRMTSLARLSLHDTNLTDAGLIHLKRMTGLYNLYLHGTKINGAGLVHLKGMKNLTVLYLTESKITNNAGVNEFQTAVPKCRIVWK